MDFRDSFGAIHGSSVASQDQEIMAEYGCFGITGRRRYEKEAREVQAKGVEIERMGWSDGNREWAPIIGHRGGKALVVIVGALRDRRKVVLGVASAQQESEQTVVGAGAAQAPLGRMLK